MSTVKTRSIARSEASESEKTHDKGLVSDVVGAVVNQAVSAIASNIANIGGPEQPGAVGQSTTDLLVVSKEQWRQYLMQEIGEVRGEIMQVFREYFVEDAKTAIDDVKISAETSVSKVSKYNCRRIGICISLVVMLCLALYWTYVRFFVTSKKFHRQQHVEEEL